MAKKSVEFISFQFEPVSRAVLFDDPSASAQVGALKLLIWRSNKGGKAEVSEAHDLGRAASIEDFERLTKSVVDHLRRAERNAAEWFPARRGFWR